MVSGSDTHGRPITVRAEEEGISPRAVVDRYHPRNVDMMRRLGISFDLFTETDTENHWAVTQEIFLRHIDNEVVYLDKMDQLYCVDCEKWLADRYVEGTCPYCGAEGARGDQCDNCGKTYDATALIRPRCKFCGGTHIEIRQAEHFFLDLAALNEPLLDWLNDGHKEHWRPNVMNFTRARLESRELRGRPITRDIQWGVTIPLPGYESKRIYVWYDAVIGYLAASKEWAHVTGDAEAWRAWWQDPAARTYYFIGKDNIEFHSVIWPAELIGAERLYEDDPNARLNLPTDVPANEFMNLAGAQFSKSRGHVITLVDLLTRFDPDALRYYVSVVMPETSDSDFLWDDFVKRNNGELVAVWGNLVHRVLSFTHKHFGEIPHPGVLAAVDLELLEHVEAGFATVGAQLAGCHFRAALSEAFALAREANRYLEVKSPWSQLKVDREAAATTLYVALQAIDMLKTMLAPFLPFTAEKLHRALGHEAPLFGTQVIEQVGGPGDEHAVLRYDDSNASGCWQRAELPAGRPLERPEPLFTKLDESVIAEELARMGA